MWPQGNGKLCQIWCYIYIKKKANSTCNKREGRNQVIKKKKKVTVNVTLETDNKATEQVKLNLYSSGIRENIHCIDARICNTYFNVLLLQFI